MSERLSVLVVDDSEDDTMLMARELRRSGFDPQVLRVDTAEGMRSALATQRWRVILCDYRMPAFGGMEALSLLQQTGLDIPFILVSATVGEETAVAMMKAGMHDFVLKHNLGRLGAVVARELREADTRERRRWAEAALEILAEAGRLGAEAPELGAIIGRAANIVVPRLADWCIVYARAQASVGDAVATAARPGVAADALAELAQRYPPTVDPNDPWLGNALAARTPQLVATLDDGALATVARDQHQQSLLRALEARSLMIVPQVAGEHLVGVIVLASQRPGRYGDSDMGIATDIGSRIALVVENARLSREREEFISTAVHEIKTPIAVIKTAVQLIQELSPEQRERRLPDLLDRLNRQCNRLNGLVTEVLEVSRLDLNRLALTIRHTDLTALVELVVSEMRDTSRRHELVIVRNDAVTLDADPDRLEQVLTNLISNAIKYSPAGSRVEIESRRMNHGVWVSVRDHGIGIPRDKQAHIFERFYRAHAGTRYDHASSLGIGLYLSREFVRRHGGQMCFESQEGVGSTFGFWLPLEEPR